MVVAQEGWVALDRERLLWLYDRMALIREFEERLKQLVDTGLPVGAVALLRRRGGRRRRRLRRAATPTTGSPRTHRGHGHCIAKGVDVRPMMAELYGKATGTNRGKGGSMHITDIRVGMLGVNPIVGMGATHAVGAGLSAKVRGTGQVAAAFFGDGAASIGAVHEALNMAAIWKLPVDLRLREQRLRAGDAGRVRDRRRRTSPTGPPATACPASSSTARTCFAVLRGGRGGGQARARPATARR